MGQRISGKRSAAVVPRVHARRCDDRLWATCFIDLRLGLAKARAQVSGVVALIWAAVRCGQALIWPAQPRAPMSREWLKRGLLSSK